MAVNLVVKVHPVVLFQIADSYERRNFDNHRVIGTLVGSVDKQCVEVTNCFCIPHKEYEERVEADIVYAQEMFELNKKVAPHEALVGWFATGSETTSHSALIHDYYARETKVILSKELHFVLLINADLKPEKCGNLPIIYYVPFNILTSN